MNNFGYALFVSFYGKLNIYISTVFSTLMEHFSGFAIAFGTLYIIIGAYRVLWGKGLSSLSEAGEVGMGLVFAGALLQGMIYGNNYYMDWVVLPVVQTTTKLAGFFINEISGDTLTGSGIKALFQGLDALSYQIFDFLLKYDPPGASWATNAWGYMQAGLLVIALFASYAGAYVVFLVLLILGYFSLYVLFTVGGICIFFGCFKKTRFIFTSWVKAVANYALVIVFTSIIMSICYFGLQQELTALMALKGSNALFTTQYLSALCWSILTFGVLLKAPDFAAALSGGQAGSTSGIAGGIGMVASAGAPMVGLKAMTGGGGKSGLENRGAIQAGVAGAGRLKSGVSRAFSRSKGIVD